MTNNHIELVGVETDLKSLLYKLNEAARDGTLMDFADTLTEIGYAALKAGLKVNEIRRQK
jgi:hypothetical protein